MFFGCTPLILVHVVVEISSSPSSSPPPSFFVRLYQGWARLWSYMLVPFSERPSSPTTPRHPTLPPYHHPPRPLEELSATLKNLKTVDPTKRLLVAVIVEEYDEAAAVTVTAAAAVTVAARATVMQRGQTAAQTVVVE
jgi:hypothetical protein